MAVKLGSLRANLKREQDGDWIDIPDLPGVRMKVRGLNYGPYLAALSIVNARNARRHLAKGEDVPHDIAYKANARLYLDHLLIDWEGLVDEDNEPIPIAQAEEILTDPAYRELHQHIRYAALKVGEIEAEFVEDAAKNSARSSVGKSPEAA